jgi:hypothetical protein
VTRLDLSAEGAQESGAQPDHGERRTQSEQDARVGDDTADRFVEVGCQHAPNIRRDSIGRLAHLGRRGGSVGPRSGDVRCRTVLELLAFDARLAGVPAALIAALWEAMDVPATLAEPPGPRA